MIDTYFLDTNIIIYAQDPRDLAKQKIANELVREALGTSRGVISSQVVQEFCNVAVSKYAKRITQDNLDEIVSTILCRLWNHVPNIEFYRKATNLHSRYSLSFYDALIIQAAIDLGCKTLYSEDLQDGQVFGSLTIKNPFKN